MGAGRKGDRGRAIHVPQGPPAKEKRHSIRGRNGAFNVQTQPVYHFPGKNQTSVELLHTLTVLSDFSWTRGANGLWRKPRNSLISSPHSTHTQETVMTWPTQGLWWPSWCKMVHNGTLVMSASQDGGRHSTQWAKIDVMWDGGQLGTYYTKKSTKIKCIQQAQDAIETVSPSHPKGQPKGCSSR